MTFHLILTATE